ncbi:MAG: LacI family DNA-binding transcriptional regulator [Chloroflexi bacterium]|nr:LacI family DNA-binding transcriptional regulator [Chloroflexota bacterium]
MASATLKSIAKATGYSVTTVSRALGGFDDVNVDTRQLILQEAQRQGYEPNLQARALQTQRTQTLALVVSMSGPRFPDPFFSEFVAGLGTAAAEARFDLLLVTPNSPADELDVYRRLIAGRRVDGVALIRARFADARIQYLAQTEMPFVVFGRTTGVENYNYIDVDGIAGQSALTQHFIDLGHKRIAYVMPPRNIMFTHYRLQGFSETMRRAGLAVSDDLLQEAELNERGGSRAAETLLNLALPPTAIMAGNDLMALGVMRVIQERGLRVGTDVAVGGFDDIPIAEHMHPGLTTVHQPIFEIGQQVTRILLHRIANPEAPAATRLITPQLMVRASSGPQRL